MDDLEIRGGAKFLLEGDPRVRLGEPERHVSGSAVEEGLEDVGGGAGLLQGEEAWAAPICHCVRPAG